MEKEIEQEEEKTSIREEIWEWIIYNWKAIASITGVLFLIISMITLFAFAIISINKDAEQDKLDDIQKYTECVGKTNDVEWCFNEFRPYLDSK